MNAFQWRNKHFRLGVKLAVAAAVVALVAHGFFASNGLFTYLQKRGEYNALREQIKQTQQQNQELQKEVHGLKSNPTSIERYAREELHMARRKEMIYVLPQPVPKTPSSASHTLSSPPRSRPATSP